MTIATTTSRVDVIGNGTATGFSFSPVVIFEATDLQVTLRDPYGNETVVLQGTGTANYSLVPMNFPGTGAITYPAIGGTPLPAGWQLTMKRVVPLLQNVALGNQGAYFPNIQEGEFDYLTAICQQQQEQISRSVQLAATDPATPLTLPTSVVRANQFLAFDSSGNPIAAAATSGVAVSTALQAFLSSASTSAALALLGGVPTLPSIAALQAFSGAAPAVVIVSGFYAPGDAGGGIFVYQSGTAAASVGMVIVDASGNRYVRFTAGQMINLRWFGAKGDLSQDDSSAVNAMVNYAAGRQCYAPAGQYKMIAGCASLYPIHLLGDGHGCGPGPAAVTSAGVTQFLAASSSFVFFQSTSNYPSSFDGIQINGYNGGSGMVGGGGICILGPLGSTNANSVIRNCGFTNCYRPIRWVRCSEQRTEGCYFDTWSVCAWSCETTAGIEGGGGFVSHNFFFGTSGDTTHGPAIIVSDGYATIHHNLFAGGIGAIQAAAQVYPEGGLDINHNWIEEQTNYGISVSCTDGNAMTLLRIQNNEFSNVANITGLIGHIVIYAYSPGGTATSYLSNVIITGNTLRSQLGPSGSYINCQTGTNVLIADNIIQDIGGNNPIGIAMSAQALIAPVTIKDNLLLGNFSARYTLATSGVCTLIDSQGMTTAQLSGYAANGSSVYVTDGHRTSSTNATVISGGPGCRADRLAGSWQTWVA